MKPTLAINWYGFFGADTDTSAIHGPIADISKIFCNWRHKWSSFGVILAHVAWLRAQLLGQSVLLKFSLETRLESESFEPLIDFLAFLVQKLWSKINKLINNLMS